MAIDLRGGTCWHTSPTGIVKRHAPWSTFKIPHFLIALESQAVSSPGEVHRWDTTNRPAAPHWPDAWAQDQSLESAFTHSAAWPFQEMVSKIGQSNYTKWLGQFKYGNGHVPLGRDDFWLGGPLAISVKEQVAFLSCLAVNGCGASSASVRALEAVALQGDSGGHRLYAKTGSGPIKPGDFSGRFEGWYVGYLRNAQGAPTAAFATYVVSDTYSLLRTYRASVSHHVLSELGLWQR